MDQYELNRQIAEATGESVATISALGFSLLTLPPPPPPERRFRHFQRRMGGRGLRRVKRRRARVAALQTNVARFPTLRGGA